MINLLFLIPTLGQFIVLLFLMFESFLVGYLLVYHPKFNLQQINAFNVFPFICVKCTTFWTNFIQNIILAYIWNPMFFVWGLITASILAYCIWFSNER